MSKDVLWTRPAQTECKHEVLRRYLSGWFPILGTSARRLLFVDGFAGPGEHVEGQAGSPLVALDCVQNYYRSKRMDGVSVNFLLIEKDPRRAAHLRQCIRDRPSVRGMTVIALPGDFDSNTSRLLNAVDSYHRRLSPSFWLLDPFGVKGVTMEMIGRILSNPKSEILVSHMDVAIRRFSKTRDFAKSLTALYGTDDWRRSIEIRGDRDRKHFLHALFTEQLKKHGARFVVRFELWNRGTHVYTMFFATGHEKGCNLMKEVVWRLQPDGTYRLRSESHGRRPLFDPVRVALGQELRDRFGRSMTRIAHVEEFMMGDETKFHKGHLRAELRRMEEQGLLEKVPHDIRGFPSDRVSVRFLDGTERRPRSSPVGGGRSLFAQTNP